MFTRQGKPEEELFMKNPANEPDTPTVEPLRIHKRRSLSSQSTGAQSENSDRGSSNRPASTKQPSGPPYPIDQSKLDGARHETLGYPPPLPLQRSGMPPAGLAPSGVPTGSGPKSSLDGQSSPTLAQRRGTIPLTFAETPAPRHVDDANDGLFAKRPQRAEAARKASGSAPGAATPNPYPEYHQQYWPPPITASNAGTTATPRPSDGTRPAEPNPAPFGNVDLAQARRGTPPTGGRGEGVNVGAGASAGAGAGAVLAAPKPDNIQRLNSAASTYTTRAERGSPPPPETPITPAGNGPTADFAPRFPPTSYPSTAMLGGGVQTQNSAATQRTSQYGVTPPTSRSGAYPPSQRSTTAPRPWTPTESPGSQPFGPPTVYQGPSEVVTSPPLSTASQPPGGPGAPAAHLPGEAGFESDMNRMHISPPSPPPAYSSVTQGAPAAQSYPNEKRSSTLAAATSAARASMLGPTMASVGQANAQPPSGVDPGPGSSSQSGHDSHGGSVPHIVTPAAETPGPALASPPPLPEGWIAHLDQRSGQYYYIHLPTQSTQWEFPKGHTPLSMTEPLSPALSTYVSNPLASPSLAATFSSKPLASPGFTSPGFPSGKQGYAESIMSVGGASTISNAMSGPPPVSGVDMYKLAPTNGVYFGPYLKYINMDLERGVWLGSILLVTDTAQPPSIHIHQSADLSPNPRQLKAYPIHTHQRWVFYRYDVDLQMEDEGGAKWTYAITSHLGCTRYEFIVAGRHETSWRFVAHSGNDFSMNVSANERQRLGGVSFMWKDLLQRHAECGGFHVQLGLGDQIYGDRVWKEVPLLKQWLSMGGKDNRKNAPWTAKHEEDVTHAYFHYYTSHFDQPHLREAFAQIPHVLQIDDHDIFDGFGSYPDYMQLSHMFKNIGRIGIEMYLLFQHHTNFEILRSVSTDQDIFTITGTGWHFIKFLGPSVVVVGPDCRSERNPHRVMAGPTYQGLFPKVASLPSSVQHCIWMISVPLIYPRLEAAESLANTVATGKKAVTGAYNVLGKVTSSVAGVVGAKGVVGEGFNSVKRAVGKSGLMGGILSPFGDIDVLDELRDQWTHDSKDLERTYLIRTLQGIAKQRCIRMTFFSGDVNCCGAGLVHDPAHPSDHKTMYQIISSSIVSAPPSSYVVKFLHNDKPLYVPPNAHRSNHTPTDTKEDMMEMFKFEVNGTPREHQRLMPRRNYVACVAFDPEVINGATSMVNGNFYGQGKNLLSLAVDFMVQGEGVYGPAIKYGPAVIPGLEFGR